MPGDHAQQPADVVARCAQHRVQPVPDFSLEVTVIHAVIGLEVADDGFNRLAPLEQPSVLLADPVALAPVHSEAQCSCGVRGFFRGEYVNPFHSAKTRIFSTSSIDSTLSLRLPDFRFLILLVAELGEPNGRKYFLKEKVFEIVGTQSGVLHVPCYPSLFDRSRPGIKKSLQL